MLDDTHESGGLNFVSGDNVTLTTEGNSIRISARGGASTDTVRPIQVEGEEVLNDSSTSGALNLVGGKNVTLSVSGNSVVISASGSGEGGGGDCDCPEIIEGEGIDVIENLKGQKVISLEKGAITDDYIDSISFEKIKMSEKTTLILNGGKANDSDN
jgi:antitoxin component of MazEF toxin-antitoxin module